MRWALAFEWYPVPSGRCSSKLACPFRKLERALRWKSLRYLVAQALLVGQLPRDVFWDGESFVRCVASSTVVRAVRVVATDMPYS